jgi:hypothetical protein
MVSEWTCVWEEEVEEVTSIYREWNGKINEHMVNESLVSCCNQWNIPFAYTPFSYA